MCPSKVCISKEIWFWKFQFDNIIILLISIQQCYWCLRIRCKRRKKKGNKVMRKWHPATPSFNDCISFSIGDLPTINKVLCLVVEIEASLFDCFHVTKCISNWATVFHIKRVVKSFILDEKWVCEVYHAKWMDNLLSGVLSKSPLCRKKTTHKNSAKAESINLSIGFA